MLWYISNRADPRARKIADRHYNRQKIGSTQFVPPGRCLVLLTACADALWVTTWPFSKYVKHEWAGAWINSLFRNESTSLSSELIISAVAATRWYFGPPPEIGFITFINTDKIRRKRDPGRCYHRAGWKTIGKTKGGLVALQQLPDAMPVADAPYFGQYRIDLDTDGEDE